VIILKRVKGIYIEDVGWIHMSLLTGCPDTRVSSRGRKEEGRSVADACLVSCSRRFAHDVMSRGSQSVGAVNADLAAPVRPNRPTVAQDYDVSNELPRRGVW
jgi:hypothetical protein